MSASCQSQNARQFRTPSPPKTAQTVPVAASVAASDADVDECEETEEDERYKDEAVVESREGAKNRNDVEKH